MINNELYVLSDPGTKAAVANNYRKRNKNNSKSPTKDLAFIWSHAIRTGDIYWLVKGAAITFDNPEITNTSTKNSHGNRLLCIILDRRETSAVTSSVKRDHSISTPGTKFHTSTSPVNISKAETPTDTVDTSCTPSTKNGTTVVDAKKEVVSGLPSAALPPSSSAHKITMDQKDIAIDVNERGNVIVCPLPKRKIDSNSQEVDVKPAPNVIDVDALDDECKEQQLVLQSQDVILLSTPIRPTFSPISCNLDDYSSNANANNPQSTVSVEHPSHKRATTYSASEIGRESVAASFNSSFCPVAWSLSSNAQDAMNYDSHSGVNPGESSIASAEQDDAGQSPVFRSYLNSPSATSSHVSHVNEFDSTSTHERLSNLKVKSNNASNIGETMSIDAIDFSETSSSYSCAESFTKKSEVPAVVAKPSYMVTRTQSPRKPTSTTSEELILPELVCIGSQKVHKLISASYSVRSDLDAGADSTKSVSIIYPASKANEEISQPQSIPSLTDTPEKITSYSVSPKKVLPARELDVLDCITSGTPNAPCLDDETIPERHICNPLTCNVDVLGCPKRYDNMDRQDEDKYDNFGKTSSFQRILDMSFEDRLLMSESANRNSISEAAGNVAANSTKDLDNSAFKHDGDDSNDYHVGALPGNRNIKAENVCPAYTPDAKPQSVGMSVEPLESNPFDKEEAIRFPEELNDLKYWMSADLNAHKNSNNSASTTLPNISTNNHHNGAENVLVNSDSSSRFQNVIEIEDISDENTVSHKLNYISRTSIKKSQSTTERSSMQVITVGNSPIPSFGSSPAEPTEAVTITASKNNEPAFVSGQGNDSIIEPSHNSSTLPVSTTNVNKKRIPTSVRTLHQTVVASGSVKPRIFQNKHHAVPAANNNRKLPSPSSTSASNTNSSRVNKHKSGNYKSSIGFDVVDISSDSNSVTGSEVHSPVRKHGAGLEDTHSSKNVSSPSKHHSSGQHLQHPARNSKQGVSGKDTSILEDDDFDDVASIVSISSTEYVSKKAQNAFVHPIFGPSKVSKKAKLDSRLTNTQHKNQRNVSSGNTRKNSSNTNMNDQNPSVVLITDDDNDSSSGSSDSQSNNKHRDDGQSARKPNAAGLKSGFTSISDTLASSIKRKRPALSSSESSVTTGSSSNKVVRNRSKIVSYAELSVTSDSSEEYFRKANNIKPVVPPSKAVKGTTASRKAAAKSSAGPTKRTTGFGGFRLPPPRNTITHMKPMPIYRTSIGHRFQYLVRLLPVPDSQLSITCDDKGCKSEGGSQLQRRMDWTSLGPNEHVVDDKDLRHFLCFDPTFETNTISTDNTRIPLTKAMIQAVYMASSWAVPSEEEEKFLVRQEIGESLMIRSQSATKGTVVVDLTVGGGAEQVLATGSDMQWVTGSIKSSSKVVVSPFVSPLSKPISFQPPFAVAQPKLALGSQDSGVVVYQKATEAVEELGDEPRDAFKSEKKTRIEDWINGTNEATQVSSGMEWMSNDNKQKPESLVVGTTNPNASCEAAKGVSTWLEKSIAILQPESVGNSDEKCSVKDVVAVKRELQMFRFGTEHIYVGDFLRLRVRGSSERQRRHTSIQREDATAQYIYVKKITYCPCVTESQEDTSVLEVFGDVYKKVKPVVGSTDANGQEEATYTTKSGKGKGVTQLTNQDQELLKELHAREWRYVGERTVGISEVAGRYYWSFGLLRNRMPVVEQRRWDGSGFKEKSLNASQILARFSRRNDW